MFHRRDGLLYLTVGDEGGWITSLAPEAAADADAGTPDAGAPDAGAPDAGAPDAGAP
jgi:hypothetical protein